MPNIAKLTAALQAARLWVAVLNVERFFIALLKEEDKEKPAFTWEAMQYTFNRLPPLLINRPTIAHAELSHSLTPPRCETVPIYRRCSGWRDFPREGWGSSSSSIGSTK